MGRKAKQPDEPKVPLGVQQAVEEYAKGLSNRSDMSEDDREEAIRHYRDGLMKFHQGKRED